MKFFKAVLFSFILFNMALKADVVENAADTSVVESAISIDEVAALSTGSLSTNRHGTSTPPPQPDSPMIPEPASALLLGAGLISVAMLSRRKQAKT